MRLSPLPARSPHRARRPSAPASGSLSASTAPRRQSPASPSAPAQTAHAARLPSAADDWSAALHEAQIVGVIDDAGKIRVLVVDADLHAMPAVDDGAVEGGGHV